jgi:uracil phosphoribosyltransferase
MPEPLETGPTWRPDPVRWPRFHVSRHPAVLHKLAILRDESTEPKKFREVVRELSWLLGEALGMATKPIGSHPDRAAGRRARLRIGLVPILRAGSDGRRDARAHAHGGGLGCLPG